MAENESQLRLLYSHDWMQQEEAFHRLQARIPNPEPESQKPEAGSRNPKLKIRMPEPEPRSPRPETRDSKPENRIPEHGSWNSKTRTRNPKLETLKLKLWPSDQDDSGGREAEDDRQDEQGDQEGARSGTGEGSAGQPALQGLSSSLLHFHFIIVPQMQ